MREREPKPPAGGSSEDPQAEREGEAHGMSESDVSTAEYFEGKKVPPITFEIAYGSHARKEDMPQLEEIFARSDVFIMECFGKTRFHEYRRNIEAQGGPLGLLFYIGGEVRDRLRKREEERTGKPSHGYPDFSRRIRNMIFRSKKPIVFVDVEEGSPIYTEALQSDERCEQSITEAISEHRNLEKTLQEMNDAAREYALIHRRREDTMLGNINSAIGAVMKKSPSLAKKDSITVGMFLGSGHTRVAHKLRERGEDVLAQHEQKPFIFFSPQMVHVRYFDFLKEPPREVQVKALFEQVLEDHMNLDQRLDKGLSTGEIGAYHARVLNSFDYHELEEIWNAWSAQRDRTLDDYMQEAMEKREIPVPLTRQEYERYMSS